MKRYFEKYFGIVVKELEVDKMLSLPIYMVRGRDIKKYEINGIPFIVVQFGVYDKYKLKSIKKQLEIYYEHSGGNVVFSFNEMTQVQRNALIKANVPFVAFPEQIYMPFLGIALQNKFRVKKEIKIDQMMPATQQVFLYLLYKKNIEEIMKSEVAEAVNITRTSVTRATEQLLSMKLITQEKKGKEIYIKCVKKGRELFDLAKPFLINPVQKEIVVEKIDIETSTLLAGETALGEQTMLNPPVISEYAIYKGNEKIKDIEERDVRWEDEEEVVKIQLWKYDPFLFSENKYVDPVSLICSFKENKDERIEGELIDFEEEIEW